MSDFKIILKGYRAVHINFDIPENVSIKAIKNVFAMITRDFNLSCKINRDVSISKDEKNLNILVISEKEKYESYLGYEAISEGLPSNLIIVMIVNETNMHEVTYLPRVDFSVAVPCIAKIVKEDLLNALKTKKARIKNYESQIMAEHFIKEKNFDKANKELKSIIKRGNKDTTTICLFAQVLEGLGKFDEAFKTLHESMDEHSPNYYILSEMYDLLIRSQMHEQQLAVLTELLNNFQVEVDILRKAVGSSIKNESYHEIQTILNYIIKQDQIYRTNMQHFLEVTFYIYIKHLVIKNEAKKAGIYIKKMIKHIKESSSYIKIAELSASAQNKAAAIIREYLKESKEHYKYYNIIMLLSESEKMTQSQIINRCKELIDYEDIKHDSIFKLFFDTLDYIGNIEDLKKYKEKYGY